MNLPDGLLLVLTAVIAAAAVVQAFANLNLSRKTQEYVQLTRDMLLEMRTASERQEDDARAAARSRLIDLHAFAQSVLTAAYPEGSIADHDRRQSWLAKAERLERDSADIGSPPVAKLGTTAAEAIRNWTRGGHPELAHQALGNLVKALAELRSAEPIPPKGKA